MGVGVTREGAGAKAPKPRPAAGTPMWVWVIYAFGLLAAAIFVFSLLFTAGALILSDDVPVTYDISTPAIVLWGGLILAAAVTWVLRRRQRR
jgi:LPXTG-motif cell wall-anchored protein